MLDFNRVERGLQGSSPGKEDQQVSKCWWESSDLTKKIVHIPAVQGTDGHGLRGSGQKGRATGGG